MISFANFRHHSFEENEVRIDFSGSLGDLQADIAHQLVGKCSLKFHECLIILFSSNDEKIFEL